MTARWVEPAPRPARRLKIALLHVRHPPGRLSPIVPEVARLLAERGALAEVLYPEEHAFELCRLECEYDLYVLKSGTDTALSLAGALEAAGAAVLNPYRVAAALRDKIVATRRLAAVGVPMPKTWVARDPRRLAAQLLGGPLVVKPYRGSQGRGVKVVREPGELADLRVGQEPVFAQRYHEARGPDRKLYRIGDEIFGVERVWPARTYEQKLGEPFPVTGELRDIVLRCGAAFGIDLYGVDVVEAGRPYVVDMSSFPGFKGVPDAAALLADYIYEAGWRAREGVAPPSALLPMPA